MAADQMQGYLSRATQNLYKCYGKFFSMVAQSPLCITESICLV